MKLKVFSIFDEKAQTFSRPMLMVHKGEAIRAFQDVVADKSSMIAKHPDDYKLYCLGSFDDVSGKMEALDIPEFMNNATDFLDVENVPV